MDNYNEEKKERRKSVKINLDEYPDNIKGLIIKKLHKNEDNIPIYDYKNNTATFKMNGFVYHVSPIRNLEK